MKIKVKKFPDVLHKFLSSFSSKFLSFGFIQPRPQASLQAVQQLDLNSSKAKFQSTIDLRPANNATIAEQRPAPTVEVKMGDFKDSKCFA